MNEMLLNYFLKSNLNIHIDTREHYFEVAKAIEDLNLRWCSGSQASDYCPRNISEGGIKISIREYTGGRLEFSSNRCGLNCHDGQNNIWWYDFLDLLPTNLNPVQYFW